MSNFDDEVLPDFNEKQIKDAATAPTGKLGYYKWRVTNASKDVSKPASEGGGGKGLLMVVLEHTPLKEQAVGSWVPASQPKPQRRYLILPRTPSKGILVKRGYTEAEAVALLGDAEQGIPATFDPNGPSNFFFNSFRQWARAAYPGSFAPFPQFDKQTGSWTAYDANGTASALGSGDAAAQQASDLKRKLMAEIVDFAGKLWADPKLAVGTEYYDELRMEQPKLGKQPSKYPNLAGFPRTGTKAPTNKDGVAIPVIGAMK